MRRNEQLPAHLRATAWADKKQLGCLIFSVWKEAESRDHRKHSRKRLGLFHTQKKRQAGGPIWGVCFFFFFFFLAPQWLGPSISVLEQYIAQPQRRSVAIKRSDPAGVDSRPWEPQATGSNYSAKHVHHPSRKAATTPSSRFELPVPRQVFNQGP